MLHSMKCSQCSITFDAPPAGERLVACPHCGASLVVDDRGSSAPTVARKRPALTDDDVLEFLGLAPDAKPPMKR